ncbi:CU044_5270 family protein [Nonomuraea sp. NPDC049480]|uniref:CU044_5270 family protein n=1 Tax=Nonomuraea sp. NPDC049480 TaxID=3364353 RepID=UPI0037A69A6D
MDELHRLRERHDALPDPSARSVAAARARLTAHMSKPATRRPPVRPLWGIGLVAACAAAIVAVSIVGRAPAVETPRQHAEGSTSPAQELRLRPVASARDLADNAAAMAAAEDEGTPAAHEWAYLKKRVARTRADGGEWTTGFPEKTAVHEMWRRADDKRFAGIENGKLKIMKGSEFEVPYPFLLSLPADPAALLGRVYEQIDAEQARHREGLYERMKQRYGERKAKEMPAPVMSAEDRHMRAFQYIALGMSEAVLPPRLRAAMYGAMARIPGVTYAPRASDLARRKGVALYRIHGGYLRDDIFIDPQTYAYLGYRTMAVRDHDDNFSTVKKGQIMNWEALLETAIVAEAGRRTGS